MDAFLTLPREKTRRGAGKPMVENNVVQSHVAQSEARWRSARYFLHAAADEALETIEEHGDMDLDQRTRLRLASTWAIQSSREIVNTLYHDCGSMAVFEENPFERRLRDIHTVAQQGQGRHPALRDGRPGHARPDAGEHLLTKKLERGGDESDGM